MVIFKIIFWVAVVVCFYETIKMRKLLKEFGDLKKTTIEKADDQRFTKKEKSDLLLLIDLIQKDEKRAKVTLIQDAIITASLLLLGIFLMV